MSKGSPAVQDYLKAIYLEAESHGSMTHLVATTAIANRLDVSAASATNMVKKLASLRLVRHSRYKGVRLTTAGRKVALEVVRHHRLLETYLAEALGVPWDAVHDEAEVLEHVLSEDLEERIARHLGHPVTDPHGHPIPSRDLELPELGGQPLWGAVEDVRLRVQRVPDWEPEVLRYLGSIGIRPGVSLSVVRRGPQGGPLFVAIESEEIETALSKEMAETIWVA